jgi:hypothetical protein
LMQLEAFLDQFFLNRKRVVECKREATETVLSIGA